MEQIKIKASHLETQRLIDAAHKDRMLYKELYETGEFKKPGYNPRMKQCHEDNAQLLEQFLATYGWPLPSVYGQEVHEAAWLIAIHAISHPDLIKKVAQVLKNAWDDGLISGKYYANFYDRIALYEGRQQLYGTHLFESKHGWRVCNLEDPATVNVRRAAIGLSSLEDWLKEAGEDGSGITDRDENSTEEEFIAWCKETGWR